MLKKVFLALAVFFIFIYTNAQDDNELRELFLNAEDHFYFEEYGKALTFYQKLTKLDNKNYNYKYKLGVTYLMLKSDLNKSINLLIQACENINENYIDGYFKEKGAPYDAFYYLGMAYHKINHLDSAIYYYKKFKNTLDVYDVSGIDYIKHLIKTCNNAKELMAAPVYFEKKVINLDKNFSYLIQSGSKDCKVYLYENENSTEIYYIKGNNSELKKIEHLSNQTYKIYPTSLSFNGNDLYLSMAEKYDLDIYISTYNNGQWTVPIKLNKNINSKFNETHACISPDNQVLYFTSDRKKGFGGLDIYYALKDEKGEWDDPINIGDDINTVYNENTPQINNQNNTLYFSSEGHYSMGGYDIFQSSLKSKVKWSSPVNLGYPINTTDNNLYYFPGSEEDEGYCLVSSGDNHLQLSEIKFLKEEKKEPVAVQGSINLQDNNSAAPVNITLTDNDSNKIIEFTTEPGDGSFSYNLPPGNYELTAEVNGYQADSKIINIPKDIQADKINVDIDLVPKEVASGKFLGIKNIFFYFDSYNLNLESKIELERITNFITRNPSSSLIITGYSDSKGTDKYNQTLSERRAKTVYNYFIENGISKNKITFKAEGEKRNIALNVNPDGSDNPTGRRYNRRVEVQIKNTDKNITIDDNLYIPEYLIASDKKIYTILLCQGKNVYDPSKLNITGINQTEVKIHNFQNGIAYTYGNFENKANAIPLLNNVIEAGFNNAKIIEIHEINHLFKSKSNINFEEAVYTIQLIAVLNNPDKSYFKGIKDIKITKGDDNFFRYTYGEYYDYESALKALDYFKCLGFTNAFIKKIESVPNYYDFD